MLPEFDNLSDALTYAAQEAFNAAFTKIDLTRSGAMFVYLGAGGLCYVTSSHRFDDFDVAICVQWFDDVERGPGIYTGIVSTNVHIDLGAPLPVRLSPGGSPGTASSLPKAVERNADGHEVRPVSSEDLSPFSLGELRLSSASLAKAQKEGSLFDAPPSATGNCPQCSMPIQRTLQEDVIAECPACALMLICKQGNWERNES